MTQVQTPLVSSKATWWERKPILTFVRKRLGRWRERHVHPFNFAIHLIGIPLAVTGVVLLFFQPWYWGVSFFVAGYLLQYIGHCVEGNDVGEWAAIKRLLGLPYVGVAPRWQHSREGDRIAPVPGK
jgi:hypothetical protein